MLPAPACPNPYLKMESEWPSKDTPLPQAICRDTHTPSVIPSHQHTPENAQETLCDLLPSLLPHDKGEWSSVVIAAQDPAVLPDKPSAWPTLCSDSVAGEQKSSPCPCCPGDGPCSPGTRSKLQRSSPPAPTWHDGLLAGDALGGELAAVAVIAQQLLALAGERLVGQRAIAAEATEAVLVVMAILVVQLLGRTAR